MFSWIIFLKKQLYLIWNMCFQIGTSMVWKNNDRTQKSSYKFMVPLVVKRIPIIFTIFQDPKNPNDISFFFFLVIVVLSEWT